MAPNDTDRTTVPPRLVSILHVVGVKGIAGVPTIASESGLSETDVERELRARPGLATYRDGRMAGWMLTPAGREEWRAGLAAELAVAGAEAGVREGYEAFLVLNEPFKRLCTDWQLRDSDTGTANDHADADYDGAVVARLRETHAEVTGVCALLAQALDRYARYEPRFSSALARLEAGDVDAFARPLSGSYHDVWMELHQDLLLTLGVERVEGRT